MKSTAGHRLVAVLAADAVGYSRRMSDDDVGTVAALDAAREIFRRAVAGSQGRVVDTAGDSVLAALSSAHGAVAAALQVQAELQRTAGPLAFRIGVHLGDVIEKDDGSIYGDGVNVAARLQALAAPGGVVVSQAVLEATGARLQVATVDLGTQSVKNIAQPVRAHALGDAAGMAPPPTKSPSLPRPRTRFFGREREKADALTLLGDGGLVTLTGIGGSGKTRLAIEVADAMRQDLGNRAWFVDLAPIGDQRDLTGAVIAALGLREQPGRDVLELVVAEIGAHRALLALDNCEHLVDAVAGLVEAALEACPGLSILATSREALGVPGERVRPVRALELAPPDDLAAFRDCGAVRLFVDRARLTASAFEIDAANAAAVHEICRRLDGIPLAIELSAARMNVLSVEQIRARLDDRFRLLGGGRRALPRHQTLAAVVRWSHDQLQPEEQRLLGRLSVFSGGWSLAAAVAVVDADEQAVLDTLSSLVSKSLVVVANDAGEARYSMLETVRQYVQERLEHSGDLDSARAAHLSFFARPIQAAEGEDPKSWRNKGTPQQQADQDNIIAALRFGIESRDVDASLRLAGALRGFWESTAQYELGWRITEEVLAVSASAVPTVPRLQAVAVARTLALWTARYDRQRALSEESLALARALNLPHEEVAAYRDLVSGALALLDFDRAWKAIAAMEETATPLGAASLRNVTHMKAELLRGAGRLDEAEVLYRANLQSARDEGRTGSVFNGCINLALLSLARRDMEAGLDWMREGVAAHRVSAMRLDGTAHVMEIVAALQAGSGKVLDAAYLHGAARAHEQRIGFRLEPVDEAPIAALLEEARTAVGAESFDRAVAQGRLQPGHAALAQALEWLSACSSL